MKDRRWDWKSVVGRAQGLGACLCCRGTWNWRKWHNIDYAFVPGMEDENGAPFASRSMSPLCVECFNELTITEVAYYIRVLVREWGESGESGATIVRAAIADTIRQKEGIMAKKLCIFCDNGTTPEEKLKGRSSAEIAIWLQSVKMCNPCAVKVSELNDAAEKNEAS